MVAAAVARASDLAAIGIDVEAALGLDPGVWDSVLTAGERRRLVDLSPPLRPAEAQFLWCVKEAALKAAQPRMDPVEIDLERDAPSAGGVSLWRVRFGGGLWHGRSLRWENWVLAAVTRDADQA